MSDCCSDDACETSAAGVQGPEICPQCGDKGKKVPIQTPKALLTSDAMKRLRTVDYRFCAAADCPVVYFGPDSVFERSDLQVAVTQKDPSADTLVCYCYGHSRASIEADVRTTGSKGPAAQISAFVKQGLCACDVRNPQGTCCLGNVAAVVKEFKISPKNIR